MTNPVICAGCHEPDRWAVFNDDGISWYCVDCWSRRAVVERHFIGIPSMVVTAEGELMFRVPSWSQK